MAEKQKIARRSFFAGLGLIAAATAAAKLTPSASPSLSENAPVEPQPKHKGYRLSEHIKKYYRTTTV
jgi:hypothetical protein